MTINGKAHGSCSRILHGTAGAIMAPLVGREGTLSVLGGHLDAAARGTGGCVVVEGPLGIGRSRLLQATAREGAERGLTVVSGRAGAKGGTPAREGVAGGGVA